MENKDTVYDKLEKGHDFYALTKGNAAQRFWHRQKFNNVIKKVDFSKKVLDIGCGPGVFFYLARDVKNGVGLDDSKVQLEFAKSLNNDAKFIEGNASKLPFEDKTFDYVTAIELIEHMKEDEAKSMIKEAYRVLKDDGRLILTTPNYISLWPAIEYFWSIMNPIDYSKEHINKQTFKKLTNALSENMFKVVDSYSFFIISPFTNFISEKLSAKLYRWETRILPRLGSIIIIEARKNG